MNIKDLPEDTKQFMTILKVEVNGKTNKFSIEEDLEINYDDIEGELERLPNNYFMWAMVYSEAKEQKEVISKKIEKRKGILYEAIQKEGYKNLRRSDIDDLMAGDKMLEELNVKLIMKNKQCQKLWYVLESLKMKNENMRSLAGFKRQEMFQAGQSV